MAERPVALVTGGASGIGRGVARALARDGHDLVVCGRRPVADVRAALDELAGLGCEVHYVIADISRAEDRAALVADIEAHFGRLDILVNNAGVAPQVRADILDASEESFDRLVSINLRGPHFLTQIVARWMIRQTAERQFSGCIVTITSVSATVPSLNRSDYCISKAGLSMASRLWAVRLAEHGIPVYEVRPGMILTDMTAPAREKYDRLIGEGLLLQARWGLPDDVGRAVAMLARGDLAYSTGSVILVDGGMTVPRL